MKKTIKDLDELDGVQNEYFYLLYNKLQRIVCVYSKASSKVLYSTHNVDDLKDYGFNIILLKKLNNIDLLREILREHNLSIVINSSNIIALDEDRELISLNRYLREYGYYI